MRQELRVSFPVSFPVDAMDLGIIEFFTYLSPCMIVDVSPFFKSVEVHLAIYSYGGNTPCISINFHDTAIADYKYTLAIFCNVHTSRTTIKFGQQFGFFGSWIRNPQ